MVLFVVLMTVSGVCLERETPYATFLGAAVPGFCFGYAWASARSPGTKAVAIAVGLLVLAIQVLGQIAIYWFVGPWQPGAFLPPLVAMVSFGLGHFFGEPDEA